MKAIKLRTGEFKTLDVIRVAVERPPHGANVSTMRAGIRVLDALDKLPEGATALVLEDQDHATVVTAINAAVFTVVNRDLMDVIDDIVDAKAPDTSAQVKDMAA